MEERERRRRWPPRILPVKLQPGKLKSTFPQAVDPDEAGETVIMLFIGAGISPSCSGTLGASPQRGLGSPLRLRVCVCVCVCVYVCVCVRVRVGVCVHASPVYLHAC